MRIPSSILAEAEQRATEAHRDEATRTRLLERLLDRPDERWTAARLATAVQLSAERVDAELAAMLVDRASGTLGSIEALLGRNNLRRHVNAWSCGPVGVYERLRVPSAYEIERWVHHGDHASLDAALSGTQTVLPRGLGEVPPLRWRGGPRLSSGAQAWYLWQRLAANYVVQSSEKDVTQPVRGAAGLVERAIDEHDKLKLAQWVLTAKLPPSLQPRVPQSPIVLDWLGALVETGELPRSRAMALMEPDRVQSRRWAFRWGELRSPRYPDVVSDERIEGLWPAGDDASGSRRDWTLWIGQVLRRAMIEQRSWRLDDFQQDYLSHPLASRVAEGLVYVVGGLPVTFVDGRAHGVDGPLTVELGGRLRVAHPADGMYGWPEPLWPAPFPQREHPVLTLDEIPDPPASAVAHNAWKRRLRALRLVSDEDARGTTTELWLLDPYRIRIEHAGYGPGYGGPRPVEGIEVSVRLTGQPPLARLTRNDRRGWASLPPWLVSEVARMLRVLFGLAPVAAVERG